MSMSPKISMQNPQHAKKYVMQMNLSADSPRRCLTSPNQSFRRPSSSISS